MAELEVTQLTQLLKFLEDERRKDKAQIAVLQERLAGQSNEIADLVRRLQELDASLRATQAAVAKTEKFNSLLDEYKIELLAHMGRGDEELKKAARESERVRLLEIETVQRQIGELRQELSRINKLEDELPTRRAEEKRLGEMIQRLQPQIEIAAQLVEERTRGVPYLEEGRRQDVKRILALEQETTAQIKKIDGTFGKLQVLEDLLGKIPPRFEPLNTRLTEHDRDVQDLRSADFRTQQQVKAFETQITQYREQVVEYTSIISKLREQAQINQRAERDLQAFQETLRQRMAEMGEVERLFEDRVKRQFEEFLGEFEKRWAKIPLGLEERWHEHDRLHVEIDKRFDPIEAFPAPLAEKIAELRVEHEKIVQAFVSAVTNLVSTNQSTLPQVSVPPAHMREDGVGLPRPVLRIK
jgi:chromosome segregation ATPase